GVRRPRPPPRPGSAAAPGRPLAGGPGDPAIDRPRGGYSSLPPAAARDRRGGGGPPNATRADPRRRRPSTTRGTRQRRDRSELIRPSVRTAFRGARAGRGAPTGPGPI